MPIPQKFFFTLSQSHVKYQKQISGNANFNRLLQGFTDFWISPQSAKKFYPKCIFLDDSVLLDKSFLYRQNLHIYASRMNFRKISAKTHGKRI